MKKFSFSLMLLLFTCFFIQAQDSTLQQYAGKYNFPDAEMQVIVKLENGVLHASFPAGTSKLNRIGVDSFDVTETRMPAKIIFRRNEEKKVNGIALSINDMILEGKKED